MQKTKSPETPVSIQLQDMPETPKLPDFNPPPYSCTAIEPQKSSPPLCIPETTIKTNVSVGVSHSQKASDGFCNFGINCAVLVLLVWLAFESRDSNARGERTHQLITNLSAQIAKLEKRLDSTLVDFKTNENLGSENNSPDLITSTVSQPLDVPNPSTYSIPSNCSSPPVLNAANVLLGAEVDTKLSSKSAGSELFAIDQSDYALLDRKEPPVGKAWCSGDEQPVLTVNLAKPINPSHVSYQHTKWNGTVAEDAPKTYDVLSCLDTDCQNLTRLASNCRYLSTASSRSEQNCSVYSDPNSLPVKKVQFHFHGNQGNVTTTCVYLVRVFGQVNESQVIMEEQKEKQETDKKDCENLKYYHDNWNFIYDRFMDKNCTILYGKNCCVDCPECCDECEMKYSNRAGLYALLTLIFLLFLIIFSFLIFMAWKQKSQEMTRK